jgi:hypothetical protein
MTDEISKETRQRAEATDVLQVVRSCRAASGSVAPNWRSLEATAIQLERWQRVLNENGPDSP